MFVADGSPEQTRLIIRRIVAALGAMRTAKAEIVRVPSQARVSCGALRARWPIAATDHTIRCDAHSKGWV